MPGSTSGLQSRVLRLLPVNITSADFALFNLVVAVSPMCYVIEFGFSFQDAADGNTII